MKATKTRKTGKGKDNAKATVVLRVVLPSLHEEGLLVEREQQELDGRTPHIWYSDYASCKQRD